MSVVGVQVARRPLLAQNWKFAAFSYPPSVAIVVFVQNIVKKEMEMPPGLAA